MKCKDNTLTVPYCENKSAKVILLHDRSTMCLQNGHRCHFIGVSPLYCNTANKIITNTTFVIIAQTKNPWNLFMFMQLLKSQKPTRRLFWKTIQKQERSSHVLVIEWINKNLWCDTTLLICRCWRLIEANFTSHLTLAKRHSLFLTKREKCSVSLNRNTKINAFSQMDFKADKSRIRVIIHTEWQNGFIPC